MRIFDINDIEIFNPDLNLGKLVPDQLFVGHHEAVEAVEEVSHYETLVEYENGGKDVVKVIDIPAVAAVPAWDEYEDIHRYVAYTAEELAEIEAEKNKPKELTIEERVAALESAQPAPAEYVAGTWYHRGDKVLFNDEVYTCIAPVGVVCVWSPFEYPAYWNN